MISGTGGARRPGFARRSWQERRRLIDVYAKNEKEDLADAEKREIRQLVGALEDEA